MKVIINNAYKQYGAFIFSVPAIFTEKGTTIYHRRNEIKVFETGEAELNVKQYRVPAFFNRIVYTYIRKPKAARAYSYAQKLLSKGFDTPPPVAYITEKKGGLIHHSYFISIQLQEMRNMYEFGKGTLLGREHIVTALGHYTARLHQAGILHKDYSPGNILFKEASNRQVAFSLVDINRMSFKKVSVKEGCKNLARLWGKEDLFRLIAKAYAEARGADADTCTRWILHYRKRFWTRYARKHTLLFDYE